jgi:hypothetical protein
MATETVRTFIARPGAPAPFSLDAAPPAAGGRTGPGILGSGPHSP